MRHSNIVLLCFAVPALFADQAVCHSAPSDMSAVKAAFDLQELISFVLPVLCHRHPCLQWNA